MKLVGEWETFENAFGLSFPQVEAAGATTLTDGRSVCRTSQQRASSSTYRAGASLLPSRSNWGFQK